MPLEMSEAEYEQYRKNQQRQEIAAEELEAPSRRQYPQLGKPFMDRHLGKLLDPDVPTGQNLDRLWIFSSEAARHLQLTIIPDREAHRTLRRKLRDIIRVSTWDADDYLAQRQALLFSSDILAGKSIGYTECTRERDALNEDRRVVKVDDRQPPPRESAGFLGFLRRR